MKPVDRLEQIRQYASERGKDKPPRAYADEIVRKPRSERARLIENLPENVKCTVRKYVIGYEGRVDGFVQRILKLKDREYRKMALDRVPESLRSEVESEVKRLFTSSKY